MYVLIKILILGLLYFVHSSKADAATDYNEVNSDGSFSFGLTNDDIGSHYHTASGSADKIVRGRYGSRNPESGRVEETVYTAGPRGFRARGPQIHRKMDLLQYPRGPIGTPDDPLADPYDDPSYSFNFRTLEHDRRESADSTGRVTGLYSYLDDIGERHTVRYAAGAGTGYEVINSVPDTPASVAYNAPLYKAPLQTRGKMSVQRGPDGQYKFILSGPDQRRSESSGPDGIVRGSYSYLDDKGIQRTVQYIAGAGIGYRVVQSTTGPGTHLAPRPAIPQFGIRDVQSNDLPDDGYLQTAESGRIRPQDLSGERDEGRPGGSRRPGGRRPSDGGIGEGGRRPVGGDRNGDRRDEGLYGSGAGNVGGGSQGSRDRTSTRRPDLGNKGTTAGYGGTRGQGGSIDTTTRRTGGPRVGNKGSQDRDGGDDSFGSNGSAGGRGEDRRTSTSSPYDFSSEGYGNGETDSRKGVVSTTTSPRGPTRTPASGGYDSNKGGGGSRVNDFNDRYDNKKPKVPDYSSRTEKPSKGSSTFDDYDDEYYNRKGSKTGSKGGGNRIGAGGDRDGYSSTTPVYGMKISSTTSSRGKKPGSNNRDFEDDYNEFPLISVDRNRLEQDREKDWRVRGRDSTIVKNVGRWYIGLPPGAAVRAHVQNIDLLPLSGRIPSPSEALKKDELGRSK